MHVFGGCTAKINYRLSGLDYRFYGSSLNDRLEQRLAALNRVNDVMVKSIAASSVWIPSYLEITARQLKYLGRAGIKFIVTGSK